MSIILASIVDRIETSLHIELRVFQKFLDDIKESFVGPKITDDASN